MSAHIGECHTSHYYQAPNQEALSPGFERDSHRVGGFLDDEGHDVFPVSLRRKSSASQTFRVVGESRDGMPAIVQSRTTRKQGR